MNFTSTELERALEFWDGTKNGALEIVAKFGAEFSQKEFRKFLKTALEIYAPLDRREMRAKFTTALNQKPRKKQKSV